MDVMWIVMIVVMVIVMLIVMISTMMTIITSPHITTTPIPPFLNSIVMIALAQTIGNGG